MGCLTVVERLKSEMENVLRLSHIKSIDFNIKNKLEYILENGLDLILFLR